MRPHVELGAVDAGAVDEGEDEVLVVAAGRRRAVGDGGAQLRCTAMAGMALQDLEELANVDAVLGLGLARQPAQGVGPHRRGEVEHRARRGRDADAVAGPDVARVQAAAVDVDPLDLPPA